MQRFNARWIALAAITLIALYLCWLIILPFVDVILWAVVLAIIAYPYHLWLRRRGLGRNTAALVSTVGVILVVLVPVAVVVGSLATQIPDYDQINAKLNEWQSLINKESSVYKFIDGYFDLDRFTDKAWIAEFAKQKASVVAAWVGQRGVSLVSNVAGIVINICFALFTLFYLLRDNQKIGEAVVNLVPLDEKQAKGVFERCQQIIQASVQGVIVIAAIQGALAALGFWALGVKPALLWGVVVFVLSLIPALGAPLVWVPAAIYLVATGDWGKAIVLTIWGGLVIGSIDNFLRPKLVGQKTGMHDLVIFFSVLGGLQVFGILGLFVGPVVVALALSIVEVFREATSGSKQIASRVIVEDAGGLIKPPPEAGRPLAHPMEIDPPRAL